MNDALAALGPAPGFRESSLLRVAPRIRCALCGSTGLVAHCNVPDHYFGVPGHWNLKRCQNRDCGLIWQDPMVIGEDLSRAYRNYYTTGAMPAGATASRTGHFGATFYRLDRWTARILRLQPARHRHACSYLDDLRPGSLLDVGCGSGAFALAMQRRGWTVRGTDFDADAAERARTTHGLAVDIGELRSIGYGADSFDAITARHVVEHVRDPVEFLAECWRILKPGGRLVFVTPNAGSLGHRHFGSRWRGLEQPRHLYLYDTRSLRTLFERAGVASVEVFSSAQGGAYVLRDSYGSSRGAIRRCIDYAAIWWLQIRETVLTRNGKPVGEELVACARKPAGAAT